MMLETGTFNLVHVLTYTFLWTTLYFLLCLSDSRRSYEWHCRMVTVVHASVVSALAFYGVFALGPWPWSEAGGPNVPHEVRTCTICLGYFLFDFTWCLYHKTEGPTMMAHHSLSILGITWCLIAGKYGTELVATIGGAEITNPLLQLRWFTKELGYYNSLWGDIIDLVFMLSFGFVRIYLGTILLYRYFQQPTDFLGRLGGCLIYALGWAFFISIIQYAVHKYTKRYRERKQNQQRQQHLHNHSQSSLTSGLTSNTEMDNSNNGGVVCKNTDDIRVNKDSIHRNSSGVGSSSSDSNGGKTVTVIGEKEIPSQREIKHRDGTLTIRKNCVVKES